VKVIDARKRVSDRITSALTLQKLGQSDALGMTLSLLHYDLDDLEAAARAEGEAEGRRKAKALCGGCPSA
jgi:hypothetical protein